jgi:hypothetical protein
MCNPFFTGPFDKLGSELHEVLLRKYYIQKVNRMIWDFANFCWGHLTNPRKGIALLVGFLILVMTCAQAFFIGWDWYYYKRKH